MTSKRARFKRLGCGLGCIFGFLPLIFTMIGGIWLVSTIVRINTQSTATGVVVDITQSRDSDGDTTYRAVIEFIADDGGTYRFTSRTGTSSRPTLGNTIEVLYAPENPEGATEKTFVNLWLFPLVFGGMGALFLSIVVFGRFRARRIFDNEDDDDGFYDRSEEPDPSDSDAFDVLFNLPPDTGESPPAVTTPVPTSRTAEFRRAEASIRDDGTMRYRIVAKDESGQEFYSELLDEDPTVAIMRLGNEVDLIQRGGRWIVDFEIPED